jgi:hypothetical protein
MISMMDRNLMLKKQTPQLRPKLSKTTKKVQPQLKKMTTLMSIPKPNKIWRMKNIIQELMKMYQISKLKKKRWLD